MEVILAQNSGFCFGVKRAVERVYEQIEAGKKIYTFGPIVHNESVVTDLENKGVQVIESEEELSTITDGTVIIRAHGVSESVIRKIEEQGLECVDAICPFVKRIHNIVAKESENGKRIIIIGNAGHPEVEGIRGWSKTPAEVIESEAEAMGFTAAADEKLCIVSQTTFNYNKFQDIVEIISKKGYNSIIRNTICNATEERQTEAKAIAEQVDAMIVVGGKNSSNTQKLYEICKNECANTTYVQTAKDLDMGNFSNVKHIGITAGASTPKNIIEEVHTNVRVKF